MDPNLISILTAMIAVVGTIAGTILGVIITSRTTETQERKRFIRGKIEETYDMLDQTKNWAKLYINAFCTKEQVTITTKSENGLMDRSWIIEGANDQSRFNEMDLDGNINGPIACPIREIERNVNLYIPSIRDDVKLLRTSVDSIQLLIMNNGANFLISTINQIPDNKNALAAFSDFDRSMVIKMAKGVTKKEVVEAYIDRFEHFYRILQRSLEKAMSKT